MFWSAWIPKETKPALSVPQAVMQSELFTHYTEVVDQWGWENFTPKELACPCCGELYVDEDAIDRLQYARTHHDLPFKINSAHRCGIHNARVGGAPKSQHKKIAFDISTHGHDRFRLKQSLLNGGFTTFGFYRSFIHTDTRPNRLWYGNGAKELWTS